MHNITSLYFSVPCSWSAVEATFGLCNRTVNHRTLLFCGKGKRGLKNIHHHRYNFRRGFCYISLVAWATPLLGYFVSWALDEEQGDSDSLQELSDLQAAPMSLSLLRAEFQGSFI